MNKTARAIRIGDKVKVDLDAVALNGMFESGSQARQFQYLQEHPDEVYVVASTTAEAAAPIQLDHPVVGETSFYEDELILEEG